MVFSELRNRDFYRQTIHLLIPVMLQQLITVGINFLDNIMVGSFGETQIAAASLANQFYGIFQFVCMGLGSGAVVMSSQFWGSGEHDKLKTVSSIAMRFTLGISAVFFLLSFCWPEAVLRCYTNDLAVVAAGRGYMRLIGSTFIMAGMSSTATYLLRSTGHVRVPLICSIIAFFVNLFFNYVFIFGVLGFPRLEIVGAAVGTVIARAFEFVAVWGYFAFKDKNLGFRCRHFFLPGGKLLRQYVRFSLPVIISDTLLGVGISLGSVIIGHISAEFVAANSIVQTGNQLLTVTNAAMAGASAVVIGNTIGAGDTDKAYRQGIAYVVLSFSFGIAFSLIILLLRRPYIGFYSVSEATVEMAMDFFLFVVIMSPIQTLAYVTSKGILRGGGDTRFLMVFDSILVWCLSLPLGALAALVWHLPPFWIYFFLKLEYGAKGLLCTARFFTKKWIRVISSAKPGASAELPEST
ncbi:MAG: MATE family efflux transporter [Ruminococcaceae bacterium]|nr:MATE family efflux transporter [Oscillospiraceae bacterium]